MVHSQEHVDTIMTSTTTNCLDSNDMQVREMWPSLCDQNEINEKNNEMSSHNVEDQPTEVPSDQLVSAATIQPIPKKNKNLRGTNSKERITRKRQHTCDCCEKMSACIQESQKKMQAFNAKTGQDMLKIILHLTDQVVSLRKELSKFCNTKNLLPDSTTGTTPFDSKESFLAYDEEIQKDELKFMLLQSRFNQLRQPDQKKFIRHGYRMMLPDNVAQHFSWKGTKEKPSAQKLKVTAALKSAFHLAFEHASDSDFDKTAQKYFQYAKDRMVKHQNYQQQAVINRLYYQHEDLYKQT